MNISGHTRDISRSNLSNNSLVIENNFHRLTSYGSLLPVLVVEAISSEVADSQGLSIRLSESGWAWLVSGRRLFVWRFKSGDKKKTTDCYELELPPSDLSHKSDLITLLASPDQRPGHTDNQSLAVVAVSPEGILRFWPNVAYESHSNETALSEHLQGQECCSLVPLHSSSCLLATTSGSLVYISIARNTPIFRTLKTPQGVLTGFSRKFSSFIFGQEPVPSVETKSLVRILKHPKSCGDESVVYVLAGTVIQKWIIRPNSEMLISEQDVDKFLRNALLDSLWRRVTTDPRQYEVVVVDGVITKSGEVLILFASTNPDAIYEMFISFATFSDELDDRPPGIVLKDFHQIQNHRIRFSPDSDEQPFALKLLLCPKSSVVYFYDDSHIHLVHDNAVIDTIELDDEDGLLGAGVCEGKTLIFTLKDNLLSLSAKTVAIERNVQEMSRDSLDHAAAGDKLEQLKRAFYLRAKKQEAESTALLNAVFGSGEELPSSPDLRYAVLEFAKEITDGTPANDPRWAEGGKRRQNISVHHSLSEDALITKQLEEKKSMLMLLIEMLQASSLWRCLESPLGSQASFLPQLTLFELLEKLIMAHALKTVHNSYSHILDPAIRLLKRDLNQNASSLQESFYLEVSKISEIIPLLLSYEETEVDRVLSSIEEVFLLVSSFSQLLAMIFKDVLQFRKSDVYTEFRNRLTEYVPWDATSSEGGIRSCLLKQLDLLVECGLGQKTLVMSEKNRAEAKNITCNRIMDLAEVVLSGFNHQLSILKEASDSYKRVEGKFDAARKKFLNPLLDHEVYERATLLAEKYRDFDTLIEICERLKRPDTLEKYSAVYSRYNFSEYLFNWFLARGKSVQMLNSSRMFPHLLEGHSDLRWLHQIQTDDYSGALRTLKTLADKESDVMKKKTILSLAKLSALASDDTDVVSDVIQMDEQLEAIFLYERSQDPSIDDENMAQIPE